MIIENITQLQTDPKTEKTARLNDRLRRSKTTKDPYVNGAMFMSQGVAALQAEDFRAFIRLMFALSNFAQFDEGNDPYGERDFGKVEVEGVGDFYFKIDYYDGPDMQYLSEDPSDNDKTFRALTLMYCSEY